MVEHSTNYVTQTLVIPTDPRIGANIHLLWYNARNVPELWQQLLDHICWPEETPFPTGLFLTNNPPGYSRLMSILEELYENE